MKATSDVLRKPVVSLESGSILGTVQDLRFSEDRNHVVAFLVRDGWLGAGRLVAFSDIESFGPDVLVARHTGESTPPEMATSESEPAIDGKRVVTRDGEDLGVVRALYFEETTGEIVGYEVVKGSFGGLVPRRYVLPAVDPLTVGKDVVFVSQEAASLLEPKRIALERLGGDSDS